MKLYKYLAPNRTDVLKNQMIRFTQHASLNDPFEMKPYAETLADDEFIKGLLCILGEDSAKNVFAGTISDLLDDIRDPPENFVAGFNAECGYNYSGTYYNTYRYSESFIYEFVQNTKRRMPEFRNAVFSRLNEIGVLSLTKCA